MNIKTKIGIWGVKKLAKTIISNEIKDVVEGKARNNTINGNRLRELRERSGYSREQVANEILVTSSIIQGWEEGWGFINPSSGEIEGLAEMFKMDEDKFRNEIGADEEYDYDTE